MAENLKNNNKSSQYIVRKKHLPLTLRTFNNVVSLSGFLIGTWLLSILIEWLGMTFIWTNQGSQHSEKILYREISYLNNDFTDSLSGVSPGKIAYDVAKNVRYYIFDWTHITVFYNWLEKSQKNASGIRLIISDVAIKLKNYFQSFINTTMIVAVRVTIATLSMPAFLIIGIAALIDGLVQRELRIYGGGIERASIYHHVKPWIKPALVTPWFLYLSMPFSVHPNVIFVPAMLFFGMTVFITAALYKKHA